VVDNSAARRLESRMTTNVPQPVFGDTGVTLPTEPAIYSGVMADLNSDFGGNLNPDPTTPQGQLASTETAIIGDNYAMFLWFVNNVDPAYNSGRMQDAIGRVYYMSRIPGSPTVQPCVCAGLNNTPISIGSIAQDQNQNLWVCQQNGTITAGSVTLNFACATNGPIPAPETLTIYQAVFGWESITPTGDAVLGQNVETSQEFEARREASVAANAQQILDAIQGQVLAVPNVLDCYCTENDNSTVQVIGGVTLGPNSIYVAALGGTSLAVATAIWSRKGPGAGYNGNTTVIVEDPSPQYLPPIPSYYVSFENPTILAFAFLVVLKSNQNIPSNATTLIQNAIIAAFAGLDGGSRAKIGSTVFASRYYGDIMALGSWAQILSITLGESGLGAIFTGSIATSTLTVTAVSAGALAPGQLLQDAGLLAMGTTIVAQLTGSAGGIGTYSVSIPQAVSSEAMTGTNLVDAIAVNINQAPAVSAANIMVILQ
jgi:hypothetical protein